MNKESIEKLIFLEKVRLTLAMDVMDKHTIAITQAKIDKLYELLNKTKDKE